MPRFVGGLGEDREFLKLWSGGLVSSLGYHVSILAMQLTAAVVLQATPIEMGILGAAQFLPRMAFGLVADLGRAALLASVPIAYAVGVLSIPQLYLVAFGVGSFSVFFSVAAVAYIP